MKNIKKTIVIFCLLFSCVFAKTQQEEYQNDILYSQEYFDYLIEYASIADFEMKEEAKKQKKEQEKINKEEVKPQDEIVLNDESDKFKLRIENNAIKKYKETIKKEDTKTTISINKKFNIIQDTVKSRNKYNSNDYRLKAGIEYLPYEKFMISTGLETNLRGMDQNPISKKFYFSPTVKFNNIFSISFINKINTMTKSTDHDVSFNLSPFKSKSADFSVYAGYTRKPEGDSSESINFATNLYLF